MFLLLAHGYHWLMGMVNYLLVFPLSPGLLLDHRQGTSSPQLLLANGNSELAFCFSSLPVVLIGSWEGQIGFLFLLPPHGCCQLTERALLVFPSDPSHCWLIGRANWLPDSPPGPQLSLAHEMNELASCFSSQPMAATGLQEGGIGFLFSSQSMATSGSWELCFFFLLLAQKYH